MPLRVHISLTVDDVVQSAAFYSHLFGSEPSRTEKDYINFRLDEPPIHLALVQSSDTRPKGTDQSTNHFGVDLPDHETLDAWRSRVENANLEFRDQPGAECCYARGDKFWITDPDNHAWEVWVRTGTDGTVLDDRDGFTTRAMDANSACCA